MGKVEEQPLHVHQQQIQIGHSIFCCERCSIGLWRLRRELSPKCLVFLILALSVFLSMMFLVIPLHSKRSGFDAKGSIKHRATVQACFRLQKPVSMLIPKIESLEHEIYEEVAVPDTKVAILSMHQDAASNWTNVVFGILADPVGFSINPVSLSLLKPSLLELFFQQSNLTLTNLTFGQPTSFGILKFPGGITVIPDQFASIWQISQNLFNFTLHNSISDIKENLLELKAQLKDGLYLRPYENVYVQVTNNKGSTRDPPVTVQAAIMSDLGTLLPPRLKQLAQTITGSPTKNLGLNNSVFGKVKEVSLSSYLNLTIGATPPAPSPAPAPGVAWYPHLSPSPSPDNGPAHALPSTRGSPLPSMEGSSVASPPKGASSCYQSSSVGPAPSPLSPSLSPVPRQKKMSVNETEYLPLLSPLISPSSSSFAVGSNIKTCSVTICGYLTFHLLKWP